MASNISCNTSNCFCAIGSADWPVLLSSFLEEVVLSAFVFV